MKKYVSLASALLVGTVFAHKKFSVTEPALITATEEAAVKEFKVAVALEAKKPVYASDVSDINVDKQDVKAVNKPEK
jgi:methionine-rich copper-binding protein CopC